ncbi:MAG: AAA family ATPase [Chlorobiaceae bacterium]|nr:AAA family ATPase [Chlorobiaceae bacterium]
MDIRLRRLRLKNFKGVKSFMLYAAESDWVSIYGRNGSGKSTLADALSWLFFGKNQVGDTSFSVKTLDESGQEIHYLEHEVEAVLEVDGKELSLRKVMTEKWAKKRGSQSPEFGGHETTYFVHEVPRKQKEYQDEVAGLVREDLFRMLSSITYFNSMRWQDRRKILLEVIGSIEDADVIAAHGDRFIEIPAIMDGRSYDDTIKMLRGRRPKIADELNVIPARVDEAKRSIPGDGACMPPQGASYSGLTARLSGLQNNRAAVLAGDTSEVRTLIADKKTQIDEAALKHQRVAVPFEIRPKKKDAERDSRCDEIEAFLAMPDGELSWQEWLRVLLEDLFVIDAPCIYPRKTKGGKLYALELIDGATVVRKIDQGGRTPMPPDIAYQQVLKGVPGPTYTREELMYRPRNRRSHRVYGFSPVEQIL